MWYSNQVRKTDQWNKIESPEIEPHLYRQLIFDKSRKINNILSTCGAGTIGFYVDMKGELDKLDFTEIENYALQKMLLKELKNKTQTGGVYLQGIF